MSHLPTVLLAEDDENDAFFLKRTFEQVDIRNPLQLAVDGQEVIDYLGGTGKFSDRSHYPIPSLIILDLKMPRKTGMDVLEWKRQQSVLHCVPSIVLSSSAHRYDIERAYRLGANAFLVKPPSLAERVALAKLIKGFWLELNQPPMACTEGLEQAIKHHTAIEIPRAFF